MKTRGLLLAICFQILLTSTPSAECSRKTVGDREDLISMIATQISRDGRISKANSKILQKILKNPGQPCRAIRFKQTVRHKDCPGQVIVIDNKMCLGQCLSRTDPLVNGQRTKKVTKCVPLKNFKRMVSFTNRADKKECVKEVQMVKSCICQKVKT